MEEEPPFAGDSLKVQMYSKRIFFLDVCFLCGWQNIATVFILKPLNNWLEITEQVLILAAR